MTTSLRFGRTASSEAMLSELVTTVRRGTLTSARAISVVVVPPVSPTAVPSVILEAASRAIRRFSSLYRPLR